MLQVTDTRTGAIIGAGSAVTTGKTGGPPIATYQVVSVDHDTGTLTVSLDGGRPLTGKYMPGMFQNLEAAAPPAYTVTRRRDGTTVPPGGAVTGANSGQEYTLEGIDSDGLIAVSRTLPDGPRTTLSQPPASYGVITTPIAAGKDTRMITRAFRSDGTRIGPGETIVKNDGKTRTVASVRDGKVYVKGTSSRSRREYVIDNPANWNITVETSDTDTPGSQLTPPDPMNGYTVAQDGVPVTPGGSIRRVYGGAPPYTLQGVTADGDVLTSGGPISSLFLDSYNLTVTRDNPQITVTQTPAQPVTPTAAQPGTEPDFPGPGGLNSRDITASLAWYTSREPRTITVPSLTIDGVTYTNATVTTGGLTTEQERRRDTYAEADADGRAEFGTARWEAGISLLNLDELTADTLESLTAFQAFRSSLPAWVRIDWEASAENIYDDFRAVRFNGDSYIDKDALR